MRAPRLDTVTDEEGLVLQVHLPCGGTMWWDERSAAEGGDGPVAEHSCDICYPDAPAADGQWRRVWAMQDSTKQ